MLRSSFKGLEKTEFTKEVTGTLNEKKVVETTLPLLLLLEEANEELDADEIEVQVDKLENKMDSTEDDSEMTLSVLLKRNSEKSSEKMKVEQKDDEWSKEREIFELQLTQLQEQLVSTMLQNQQLGEENKKLKKNNGVDLNKEFEEEIEKRKNAEERLKRVLARKKRKSSNNSTVSFEHDFDDLSTELDETLEQNKESGIRTAPDVVNRKKQFKRKVLEYKISLWNFLHERISDFINDEDFVVEEVEDEQLSVRKLKENITRFTDAIQPIKNSYYSLHNLFAWKNPWLTVTVFLMYVYSLWIEMAVPLSVMLILLQLSLNFLHARGIAQKFTHQRKADSEKEEVKEEQGSTLSERYQLVLQIARKVQNTLGSLADSLEKIQNLLLWQHEEASKKLFYMILFLFVVSCVLPINIFMMVVGLMVGMKLFLVTLIYTRFPKVQRRYDDFQRLWEDLPTHSENLRRKLEEFDDDRISPDPSTLQAGPSSNSPSSSSSTIANGTSEVASVRQEGNVSWNAIIFCDRFQLPRAEVPLHDWTEGRRCTLMDKDSPLSSMRHGRLYLTPNYICFERNQFHSKKNVSVKLSDVTEIKKAKPISFMPGSGMAIEIQVKDTAKPYIFAAMMGRDEAYDSIIRSAKLLNLPWSKH